MNTFIIMQTVISIVFVIVVQIIIEISKIIKHLKSK